MGQPAWPADMAPYDKSIWGYYVLKGQDKKATLFSLTICSVASAWRRSYSPCTAHNKNGKLFFRIVSHSHHLEPVGFKQCQITVILAFSFDALLKKWSRRWLSFEFSTLTSLIFSTLASGPQIICFLRNRCSEVEFGLVFPSPGPPFILRLWNLPSALIPLNLSFRISPQNFHTFRFSGPDFLTFFKPIQMKPNIGTLDLREVKLGQFITNLSSLT